MLSIHHLSKVAFAAFSIVAGLPSFTEAQVLQWSAIGSGGVVNQADRERVTHDEYTAGIVYDSSHPYSRVRLRFNVVLTPELMQLSNTILAVSYLDNGPSAKIVARLKEYNPVTGQISTRMQLNSNSWSSSDFYQERFVASSFDFNPVHVVYFIEVEMERTDLNGKPRLASVRMYRY